MPPMISFIRNLLVTLLVATVFVTSASAADFVHPGLINSNSRLWVLVRLEKDWANRDTRSTYRELLDKDRRFSADYKPEPMEDVIVTGAGSNPMEKRFRNDTIAAYFTALRWVKTGDDRYRAKSIEIMNAWAKTFSRIRNEEGTWVEQERLEAAWAVPIWTNAAEIILHYQHPSPRGFTAWDKKDVRRFRTFVTNMHSQIGAMHGKPSNQGVSAALADVTLGVFNDDRKLYQSGLAQMRDLMPKIIYEDGEVKELRKRDCVHPQYSLVGFTQAAQIEMNQSGKSTLMTLKRRGEDKPMLVQGIEYMSGALNKGSDARDCRSSRLIDGYAPMAKRLYANDNKVRLKQLDTAIGAGPQRMSGLFPEGTEITHGEDASSQ